MKTIILHDYFESLEGGGRLSSILARELQTDIGYGFSRQQHPFLQLPSTCQQHNLAAYSRLPLWRQLKLALAYTHRTQFLQQYNTVIYSGFYTPLAIRQHPHGSNILYCHTPPRFIYDQREFYLHSLPIWLRPALHAFINYLQPRYEAAIAKMDVIIANSDNVRQRIARFLGKESQVIYPPCETQQFVWQGQSDYYLSLGRLDPLKRVDKIIQAFLQMPDKRLVVTSGGTELARLKKLATHAPNIQFTSWLTDVELAKWIGNALATIYLPKEEDFGMSPVESMAAGKPVIGVAEGGLLETILPGKTGLLLDSQFDNVALCEAVHTMTADYALSMRFNCEQHAQQFRTAVFLDKMRVLIGD